MTGAFEQALAWWRDGERVARAAVDGIPDRELAGPSLLPGWTRKTVIAHLARNADALVNLLTWAHTGVETPMYASAEAREAGIEQAAALPAGVLRAEFRLSQDRLAAAVSGLPVAAWSAGVRTAQGRPVPASEVPWMRAREVWLHGVDLAGPVGFADIPRDVSRALIGDIVAFWTQRDMITETTFMAIDTGQSWGEGPRTVSGPLADLLTWMTGRQVGIVTRIEGAAAEAAPRWL